jgi:hypothetical protein
MLYLSELKQKKLNFDRFERNPKTDTKIDSNRFADTSRQNPLFKKLSADETGITFSNQINETSKLSYLSYSLMLNGGGVGLGDINNDGLTDIFLTGNMVSSRLYLNEGNMQFRDITKEAGVETRKWITGVSMVDINSDGYIDIYLSAASPEESPASERKNLLFINNGDNTFAERGEDYKVADTSHTTHALFLDYNKDNLLDIFLLNHSPGTFLRIMRGTMGKFSPVSNGYDKLYKNNGDETFTDISEKAGILNVTGFGLGAVVADVNRDGWPDIYVSNDLVPDDQLYINNQDGTFIDRSREYLKHTSYAGMGLDIADFNNDGWADILQADMMPKDYQKRKLMSYAGTFAQYANKVILGSNYQYNNNVLQMNNGLNAEGKVVFSEIGRITGVAYTGWSWASLFGDYDNDGKKDIIITNGIPKATNDYDYAIASYATSGKQNSTKEKFQSYQQLRDVKISNFVFKNEGSILFKDVSQQWGFRDSTYSYGAAHADLDNDGDLDIVINNLNDKASVYQNNSMEQKDNHFLSISLNGPEGNMMGIGTEVIVTLGNEKQYLYQTPYRGYQSSQDPRLHFGLSEHSMIDSIEVFWPDNRYQLLTNVKADQQVSINYTKVSEPILKAKLVDTPANRRFVETKRLKHEHTENKFNDYRIQPLLWRQLSHMGPKLAVGDVDKNGLDDFFIGGSAGSAGTLYVQNEDGSFKKNDSDQPWQNDKASEDMGAAFFDANGDGHLDLYVASGGYEISRAEDAILDRLYMNTGNGQFIKDEFALPRMYTSSSQVIPGDFNSDGEMDLFVAGRLVPYKYPFPSKSYILHNNNGKFTNVTEDVAPQLVEPGLITDAEWIDFNTDGQLDLITSGIWLPIQFYMNDGGAFKEVTDTVTDAAPTGWWYSLEKGDFNNDGAIDIVAGNAGLNHAFTTSDEEKFGVYAADFDSDLTTDIIYTIESKKGEYPFFGKARFSQGLSFIDEKFHSFESFSKASVSDIFGVENLATALRYQADTFESTLFKNKGDGTFSLESLPVEVQVSPIISALSYDIDGDKNMDLISGGNIFSTHPAVSRLDGGNGLFLQGDGSGEFQPIPSYESGLYAPGDVKDMKLISTPEGMILLVANNDGPIQLFDIK